MLHTARDAPIDRTDFLLAGGVGGIASLVFLSTFSSHMALGDAPETVVGVSSQGILHAPGYAVYVLAARGFAEVVRVGDWTLRVNLFSLVSASLAIAVVFLLGRGFTASRVGAAIGALALATSASFWFNAGFAKYYAFAALHICAIALCVVLWQQRRQSTYLVIAGILVGLSVGVSWQLALIMAGGLVILVLWDPSRPRRGVVLATCVGAALSAAVVCIYVLLRARQHPAMNYGNATDLSRLVDLLTTRDFQGNRAESGAGLSRLPGRIPSYLAILGRDVGVGAVLLAGFGGFDLYKRRRLDHALFLGFVLVANVVSLGLVSGFDGIFGFYTGLVMGGQLLPALVAIALLAALGSTRLLDELTRRLRRARGLPTTSGLRLRLLGFAAIGAVVLVVLVPSLVVHRRHADHRTAPLADHYARRVLAALPRNGVLVAGGWEYGQPIVSRRVLHHDRPDVSVVSADTLAFDWYREEVVHRFGLDPALRQMTSENPVKRIITALREKRPVFADTFAMLYGASLFGYQPEGLVGRIVDGTGPRASAGFERAAVDLRRTERDDGMFTARNARFPETAVYFFYERAHVELAKQYALRDDLDGAANELERALEFGPEGEDRSPLDAARQHQPYAKQLILDL